MTGKTGIIFGLEAVFFCCISYASFSDLRTKKVYRFVWWIAKACVLLRSILCGISMRLACEYVLFVLVQELLFRRLYGAADVQAFEAFGFMLCSKGYGYRYALYHMYISFLLLAIVQVLRKNMNSKGNLYKPVPFIPYISMGYYILIFLLESDIV